MGAPRFAATVILMLVAAGAPRAGPDTQVGDALKVGSLVLHHCETPAPWCATLSRPLDPTGALVGSLPIYFEFYPHLDPGPAAGTLVATEGGPGFPATESRAEYLEFFQPLRRRRDVVIMDNRGTGRSQAIDCKPLQTGATLTEANMGRCGEALGPKASLYSATLAVDDLAAILDALGAGQIDLYGDSYGTFFEQIFAVRHPGRLRSMVLDGAYPLDGPGYAWYPNYAPAMRAKFDLACKRSEGCSRLPGTSMQHIAPALESLRRKPITASAYDGDGRLRHFSADASQLATVMFGSSPAYASVRETDAAARAFVAGDQAPLLRLMAETQVGVDSRDATRAPEKFSAGLAAAVTCGDAPQIFDMGLEPRARAAARDEIIAARKRAAPDTYAPFTLDEYRGMPIDYSFIDECVLWPAIDRHRLEAVARLRASPYPAVPALIISGDLDNMTPTADGELVARRFPHGRHLRVPNGFHVNALNHSRSECPARIARQFMETLELGDIRCLQSIPEVRLLPSFALRSGELEPAQARTGNEAGRPQLQRVTAAVFTVADAIARIGSNTTGRAVGLRGGSIDISDSTALGAAQLTLHEVQWTQDLRVSGRVSVPGRSGEGSAELTLSALDGEAGELKLRWREGTAAARADIQGTIAGKKVAAQMQAP